MKFNVLWIAGLMLAATAGQVQAGVLTLNYSTADIGGGLYQYDFELVLTNQDLSYFPGQNFNWIVFGDEPSPGPSPIIDFAPLSETFPNPDMIYATTGGSHNGPNFIDQVDVSGGGWIPTGVNDSVTWTGTSSNNITTGLLFSNLFGSGSNSDFELANFISASVPEPSSIAMFGVGALGLIFARRKRRQTKLAA